MDPITIFGVAIFSAAISVAIAYSKTKSNEKLIFAAIVAFIVPFLGIVYALIIPKDDAQTTGLNSQPMMPSNTLTESSLDKIKKLAELRDSGAITSDEFESKKKELLERM